MDRQAKAPVSEFWPELCRFEIAAGVFGGKGR
jgi:hypothetical protein